MVGFFIAESSKGRTLDFDSKNSGSTPFSATKHKGEITGRGPGLHAKQSVRRMTNGCRELISPQQWDVAQW